MGGEGAIDPASPFNPIVILPTSTDPYSSRATPLSFAVAGERSRFNVRAIDRFGNLQVYPDVDPSGNNLTAASFNDNVTVELDGPGPVVSSVVAFPVCVVATFVQVRTSCSPFLMQFEATVSGVYHMAVQLNGLPVLGSPFLVTVGAGAPSLSLTQVAGNGLSSATVGAVSTVLVTVFDSFENPVNLDQKSALLPFSGVLHLGNWRPGCDPLSTDILPQCSGPLSLQDANSSMALDTTKPYDVLNQTIFNTIVLTNTPTAAGTKLLAITYHGAHLAASPYSVFVHNGPINSSASSASGFGMQGSLAGQAVSITVFARDSFGNLMSDALQQFDVVLDGPASLRASLARVVTEGGTFEYLYTATRAGAYHVSVTTVGSHLAGSPASVSVKPGDATAPFCVLTGSANFQGTAGVITTLLVSARDSFGNQLTSGGDLFIAEIVNPVLARTIVVPSDDGDGTYTLSFASALAGVHSLQVTLSSANIFGSPFAWTVVAGSISASSSIVYYASTVVAGGVNPVVVSARDRFGNAVSDFKLSLELSVNNETSSFAPFHGQYIYSPILTLQDPFLSNFSLTISGNYTGSVFLLDNVLSLVGSSPFHFTAVPDIASTSACYATGSGLSRCVNTRLYLFIISFPADWLVAGSWPEIWCLSRYLHGTNT